MTRCIAILGGSFDPVHKGHVALGNFFITLLAPHELRVMPVGNPWQKTRLLASDADRVEMLRRAFVDESIPVVIDTREITQCQLDTKPGLPPLPTYTIDTLRALRAELGPEVSLAFLMGADQLQQLHSWQHWQQLFEYAHLCVAARPGFSLETAQLNQSVAREFTQRAAIPAKIRSTPHGLCILAPDLAQDISATQVRSLLQRGDRPASLIPPLVLDYIEQHHLYKS